MYADSNDAAARFEEEWHQHTRTVRGVFEKVRAAL
jgi:hypothetical protein